MDILLQIGLSQSEIKTMLEQNPEIVNLSNEEISQKIDVLKQIKCSDTIIRNILFSNPFYLTRSRKDIAELLEKLTSIGIEGLFVTIDANPWILNFDAYEMDEFIAKKSAAGMSYDDIIDLIDAGEIE